MIYDFRRPVAQTSARTVRFWHHCRSAGNSPTERQPVSHASFAYFNGT